MAVSPPATVSILIATYDRPDSLAAVLDSIARQTVPPHQVVVGDDGSGPETTRVIDRFSGRLPVTHQWREHQGFRLARSRNACLKVATGDYAIFIDDDILLHPMFIADHVAAARPGFFVQASRVLLGEAASREAMGRAGYWPSLFSAGVENRKNTVRSSWLSRMFSGEAAGMRGIRTCNFAVWREDCVRVNGFNEEFVGWGREDSEFVARLYNSGVRRYNLKFAALGCHLYHPPRSRDAVGKNDALLRKTIDAGAVRCAVGLEEHR